VLLAPSAEVMHADFGRPAEEVFAEFFTEEPMAAGN
jgi:hypothetical protein